MKDGTHVVGPGSPFRQLILLLVGIARGPSWGKVIAVGMTVEEASLLLVGIRRGPGWGKLIAVGLAGEEGSSFRAEVGQ